jgi:adenosylcobyric acid synthase
MRAKAIMVQGTGSHVGKTMVVAGLCRIFARAGIRVAPFKSQNMSLNSYVTPDGKEISRAQALQAFASGLEPRVEMNPILLKPKGGMRSEVVLRGEHYVDITAADYRSRFALGEGLEAVKASLRSLLSEFEVVVIEGAGSPAEINLADSEIVNMRVAKLARAPVLLVADIERGGVFASIVGTLSLLSGEEREMVKGFVINKFRGEMSILEPGLRMLEEITGKPVLGVIPYLEDLDLPWEDSVSLEQVSRGRGEGMDVAVIRFPRTSNFTDLQQLVVTGARVRPVRSKAEMGSPDVVVIPGTKNTVDDLLWLRERCLDREVIRLRAEGVPIVGICGGYQILGERLLDPEGLEGGEPGSYKGLGLLDVTTRFGSRKKTTRRVSAKVVGGGPILGRIAGKSLRGYEIHMGESRREGGSALFEVSPIHGPGGPGEDGAVSPDGLVIGTYLHGVFDDGRVADALLGYVSERKGSAAGARARTDVEKTWEEGLDRLCDSMKGSVDMAGVFRIAGISAVRAGERRGSRPG